LSVTGNSFQWLTIVLSLSGVTCSHMAPSDPEPVGASSCRFLDPTSCVVECDEGFAPSCEKGRSSSPQIDGAPWRHEAIVAACSEKAHPNACARQGVYLLEAGDAVAAYKLAEPHCDPSRQYPCAVAAEASKRMPFARPPGWKAVRASDITVEPSCTFEPVAYPRDVGTDGKVDLLLSVASSGEIVGARISRSSGVAILDNHALLLARRGRCTPAQIAGKNVDALFRYRVRFELY
jgi:TonB family protein